MEGNNMRQFILTAIAGLFFTGSAFAETMLGGGFSLENELKAKHLIDADQTTMDLTPEVTWTTGSLDIWANTKIGIYDSNATDSIVLTDWFDQMPTMNVGADYDINSSTEVYAKTSWNFDAGERGEMELGVSFSF
jgi:hypothetical protein|tara:strand:+ start:4831 stop:5235 length:405 start_codon:yes stop_codon:yes gene_type:complete